eukprot:scaffold115610_cov65-Cyclotella_meneghiniana.AAC.1
MRSALENQNEIPSVESDASSSTRSQLSYARSQLLQVHELIKNVENHVDNQSSDRHKSRPNRRPTITTYSPRQENLARGPKHNITSTSREAKLKSRDLSTLKSEICRLWSEQEKLSAKRNSLSEKADALNEGIEMNPELIDEIPKDRRMSNQSEKHLLEKDMTSLAELSGTNFPEGGNSQHNSASIEPLGSFRRIRSDETSEHSLKKSISFLEFDESIENHNPERTPPDPEADINVPHLISNKTSHTSLIHEFPETTKLDSHAYYRANEYHGADDQSVLSLFPIDDRETKRIPDTVIAPLEHDLNKSLRHKADDEPALNFVSVANIEIKSMASMQCETNKIKNHTDGKLLKNTEKTFVKSLDRPASRRNSSAYPVSATSFSRRRSDGTHGSTKKLELPLKQALVKSLDRPASRRNSAKSPSIMFSRRNRDMTPDSTRKLDLPLTQGLSKSLDRPSTSFSRCNSDLTHISARK